MIVTAAVRGLPDNTPTWVRLHDAIHKNGEDLQFPSVIVVDAAVKNGWAAGAEILITSHTRDWDGHQVRKIVAVSDYTRRLVQIELDAPIRRPTTLLQSEDFAVEVALLSRNIVIEGGPDSKKFHGGHFWFMNTPSIVQSLVGVDFRNMGQQGTLGRYPIHLHMGSDMTGSTISKNTIRQSNQRCIVVHNTHNLLVEENIAYDTKGHCFIVEDGMETGNKFLRNLGAQTGAPDEVIPDWGPNGIETDDDPATFWITNPSNYWIGNVAAGSQGAGFWFELQLRGTHKHLFSHVDPKTAPLLKFENNVAHSNNNKGFRTYPSGYLPEQVQTLGGLKSYRNDGAGLFLHITKNIVVERSIFADNRNIGIDIDRADGISVLNSQVIGLSDSFRDLLSDQDARPSCVEDAQYGIEFHTWKHDPANVGTTIRNVTISNFINVSCPIATPFHVDNTVSNTFRHLASTLFVGISMYASHSIFFLFVECFVSQIKTGQFNMFTTFSNLKLQDPRSAIDFCDAEYAGIIDIYLNDLDGSFRPLAASSDESASLVSNNLGMLQFVNRFRCNTNEAKCYSYCTNTCFRTVRFEIDPANTADYRLRVCRRNEPSNCIYVVGQQRVEDEYDHSFEPRVFLAHLPEGTYDAAILGSRGSETWPSFVEVHYEVSNCADAVDDFVRLIEPPTLVNECNALIQNGNFERSESDPIYWTYRIGGMKLVPGSGVGGSNAVAGIERSALTTFSQFLDTRCLKLQKGRFYEVTADIKLENSNGSVFVCDSTKTSCPGIGLFTPNDYRPLAGVDPELTPRGFQSIQTIVAIDDKLASSALARFDIKSNVDDKLLVVDNVSMRLVVDESSYCDNVILTSTVERERYWAVADGGELSIVPGPLDANPSTATRQAIRIGSRRGFDDGLFYKGWRPIELACLKPGSRWRIAAQLQLAQRGTVKGVSCEGARDCPSVRVTVKDKAGNQVFAEKFQTSIPNANTFNLFKTNFTLPSDKTWDGTIGNAVVDIRFFPVEYDLIVGAFSMSYIG